MLPSATTRSSSPEDARAARLLSLDAFRGLAIAAMLLVNHQGQASATYAPFRHAQWNGWTPADLVFPFFLFIVGTALSLSQRKQVQQGAEGRQILAKTARRAVILIGIGLLLNGFPWWQMEFSTLRLPGVLQRIGLSYFMCAVVLLFFRVRGQVIVTAALLLGYWFLLTRVPVPGSGMGVLEPGRDLSSFIDRALIGTSHMWPGPWDPEGLLSTLPSVATVLLGALSGHWLQSNASAARKVVAMLGVGLLALVVGNAWGRTFPINKNLWTSSFTVFTGGTAAILLAVCYGLLDVLRWRRWARPFATLGVNAIAVYVLASLVDVVLTRISIPALGVSSLRRSLFKYFFASWLPLQSASLAFAAVYAFAWLGLMALLDAMEIRISV